MVESLITVNIAEQRLRLEQGGETLMDVAIATATMLFGLQSGAALATVVGVLIEVPVMLLLVKICLRSRSWFAKH